ncbi:hypothetical protein LZC95_20040 [Pendulispora brunnea]|uniref:Uncharacterized protein n=1 Tax=Pendulispora brunnea TaxID=2905690 RepID=A0ABZ2KKN0_9BACT
MGLIGSVSSPSFGGAFVGLTRGGAFAVSAIGGACVRDDADGRLAIEVAATPAEASGGGSGVPVPVAPSSVDVAGAGTDDVFVTGALFAPATLGMLGGAFVERATT